jgi:Family of unknown function (DUF5706)
MSDIAPTPAAVELANRLLAETREELGRADGKASILFAAATVVVAAIVTGVVTGPWSPTQLQPLAQSLWWLGTVLVAAGVLSLGMAVYPRLRDEQGRDRMTYFMHVLACRDDDAVREGIQRESADPLARPVEQLRRLGPVVKHKYRCIAAALMLLGVGALLATLAAVIG